MPSAESRETCVEGGDRGARGRRAGVSIAVAGDPKRGRAGVTYLETVRRGKIPLGNDVALLLHIHVVRPSSPGHWNPRVTCVRSPCAGRAWRGGKFVPRKPRGGPRGKEIEFREAKIAAHASYASSEGYHTADQWLSGLLKAMKARPTRRAAQRPMVSVNSEFLVSCRSSTQSMAAEGTNRLALSTRRRVRGPEGQQRGLRL